MNEDISGKALLILLIRRFFTSGIIKTLVNFIFPTIMTFYSVTYDKNAGLKWFIPVVLMLLLVTLYNISSEIILSLEKKKYVLMDLLSKCYYDHNMINRKCAVRISRLEKLIRGYIKQNKPIPVKAFDKMVDFNTIAFDICNSIYKVITEKYGKETECEVTVFKSESKKIKMVAYANEMSNMPSCYTREYKKESRNKKYLFVRLLEHPNSKPFSCANKDEVKNEFEFFDGSIEREKAICQYIGIPIKINIDDGILLQIDVSLPNIFGKNKDDLNKLGKSIFLPYATLLHKAYERDIIFVKYYELIVEKLSTKTIENKENS